MPTDLRVTVENRPGAVAEAAEALGRAGVNALGGFGYAEGGQGTAHLLVEDADAERARQALESAGLTCQEQDVIVVPVEDRPGSGGEVLRKVADAGANLDFIYTTTRGQLVLGGPNLDQARQAVGGAAGASVR